MHSLLIHPPCPFAGAGTLHVENKQQFDFNLSKTFSSEVKDFNLHTEVNVNNVNRYVPHPSVIGNTAAEDVDHNFDMSQLENLVYIASGEYANVFKAKWRGKRVAVKFLKDEYVNDSRASGDMEFEKKILTLCKSCPYVVDIFGSGNKGKTPFIVMEELSAGTIYENFHRYNTFKSKVEVLIQIARAMEFIYTSCLPEYIIMHRDIKPKNIALDGNLVPKLLDFGLARVIETRPNMKSPDFPILTPAHSVVPSETSTAPPSSVSGTETEDFLASGKCDEFEEAIFNMTGETGSLRYMAPEVCLNGKYNHKADCYSFAVLAWQIMTKSSPYAGMSVAVFKTKVVSKNLRMPIPDTWPPKLSGLLKKSWSPILEERPNFTKIVSILEDISEELEASSKARYSDNQPSGCGCTVS